MAKQLNVNLAFTADTSKAKAEINSLQQSLNKIASGVGLKGLGNTISADLQKASKSATELQMHLQKAINVNTGTLNFTAFNQSIKNSGSSIEKLGNALLKAGATGQQSFSQLATAIAKSEVPLYRTNSLLNEFWTTLKNTARWQISSSVLHGFMGALSGAYGYAKDLNESLNNIRIVTSQSTEQMARFAEQANKAARQLSTTTTKYTDAALIYYQQGLNDSEVKERTDITVKMANAAGVSAQTASEQLTAIWNNFDNGTQSLEHYADVLVKLGAETASSSDEISQGMEKFAAVAKTVGLSYEYAAAGLATVTATTRQSADTVGTAFKTLFARLEGLQLGETLEDGTDLNKYSQALATVGVNIKDVSGEMKSMDTILEELGARWRTLGKDQQIALAQTVGGMRQYTQLVAWMDNWDFFQQNLASARNSDGALQSQADIYAESWQAAANRVKAAQQSIFQDLLKDEAFINILNTLEEVLIGVDNFIDSIGGLKGILISLGSVAATVFNKQIANGIKNMGQGLANFVLGPEFAQYQKLKTYDNMITQYQRATSDTNLIGRTQSEMAQHEVNEAQLRSQKLYMMNAGRMTEDQRLMAQYHMDNNAAAGQARVKALQEQEAAANKLQLALANVKIGINELNSLMDGLKIEYVFQKMIDAAENSEISIKDLKNELQSLGVAESDIDKIEVKLDELGISADDTTIDVKELKQILQNLQLENNTASNYQDTARGIRGAVFGNLQSQDNVRQTQGAWSRSQGLNEEILNPTFKFNGLESIIAAAGAISSLSMGVTSLKNAIDTLNNTELTIGEKWSTIAMQGGMAFTMLSSALRSVANSSGVAATATKILTMVTKADTTATLANIVVKNVLAAALIAAAGALVYYIIKQRELANAELEATTQSKAATEAAENLAEAHKKTDDELKNVLSTFEQYQIATDALEQCTEGTEAWQSALAKVKDLIFEILLNSPELGKQLEFDENGLVTNWDEIIENYEAAEERAKVTSLTANWFSDLALAQRNQAEALDFRDTSIGDYQYGITRYNDDFNPDNMNTTELPFWLDLDGSGDLLQDFFNSDTWTQNFENYKNGNVNGSRDFDTLWNEFIQNKLGIDLANGVPTIEGNYNSQDSFLTIASGNEAYTATHYWEGELGPATIAPTTLGNLDEGQYYIVTDDIGDRLVRKSDSGDPSGNEAAESTEGKYFNFNGQWATVGDNGRLTYAAENFGDIVLSDGTYAYLTPGGGLNPISGEIATTSALAQAKDVASTRANALYAAYDEEQSIYDKGDAVGSLIVDSLLGDSASDAVKAILGNNFTDTVQAASENLQANTTITADTTDHGVLNAHELIASYKELHPEIQGYATENPVTLRNGVLRVNFVDVNGDPIFENGISENQMAAEIASRQVTDGLTQQAEQIQGILNDFNSADIKKDTIEDFFTTGDFESITAAEQDQYEKVSENFFDEFGSITETGQEYWEEAFGGSKNLKTLATAFGMDIDDFIKTLHDSILSIDFDSVGETLAGKLSKLFNSIFQDTDFTETDTSNILEKGFSDLGIGTQKGLESAFLQIFEEGGIPAVEEFATSLNSLEELNLNSDQIESILQAISDTDWSDPSSIQALNDKLYEITGVAIGTLGPLDEFIARMKEITNQAQSTEDAQKKYASIMEITESLSSTNRNLSADKFNELQKLVGDQVDLTEFFNEQADGSYQLSGLYEDFYNEMLKQSRSTFEQNVEAYQSKNENLGQFIYADESISGAEYANKVFGGDLSKASSDELFNFLQNLDNNASQALHDKYLNPETGLSNIPQDVLQDAIYKALMPAAEQMYQESQAAGYEGDFSDFMAEKIAIQDEQTWDELSSSALSGGTKNLYDSGIYPDDYNINWAGEDFDSGLAMDQLQLLNEAGVTEFDDGSGIADYIAKLDEGTLTLGEYKNVLSEIQELSPEVYQEMLENFNSNEEAIIENLELLGSSAESTSELWDMLNEQMVEGNITADEAQQIYSNVLDSVLQNEMANWEIPYEDVLKRAEAMKDMEKYQDNSLDQIKEMAAEIEKDSAAMEDLTENSEDYAQALDEVIDATKNNAQVSDKTRRQVDKAKKSLSQLTNIPVKNLSDKMAKAAMESKNFEKAIAGDEKAMHALIGEMNDMGGYDDLFNDVMGGDATQEQIDAMGDKFAEVNSFIQGELDKGLTAGEIDLTSMQSSLNEMLAMCGSDVEAAKKLLAALGISAELEPAQPAVQEIQTFEGVSTATSSVSLHTIGCFTHPHFGYTDTPGGVTTTTVTTDPPPSWKIKDGTGEVISTAKGGSSGGGGGGGGGGKAKPPKPHKRIDPKVRYEGTKKRIENLGKQQDIVAQKKEVAYGQERIKQAEKEIELKQRQIKLQTTLMEETKEALELQKIDIADRLEQFTGIKIEFDADGSVTNLDKIEEAILDLENHIIDLENAGADEFTLAHWNEILDMAREGFDDLLDIIEETLDAENEFWNAINELNELVLEGIQYKVELNISIDEAALEYIDYMLEKLSDEGFEAAESISVLGQKAENALSQIEAYSKGISDILATRGISVSDLINMDADDLMGLGFTQADIDALLEYRSAIIENMTTLNELRTEMVEKVSSAFSVFSDELSRQIELFEHYNGLLEHFREIASLTGSQFAKNELRDIFSAINETTMNNAQANIRAAKENFETVQAMYEDFLSTYDEATATQAEREAKAEMEEMVNEAQETFYSSWEDALSKAADILEQWVEDAGARFDEVLTPMYESLDRLEEAYDRMNEQDENYYDNYEQLYHLSQLTRDISNSIDDTDNIKGKQRLRDLMKEITDIQARGVELSEYDVDILRKRYELEQARQALEDAEDNASLVRLQRDQEGNWGYVYTADEDAVDEAEKEYENKLYELQKANDEYIKELQDRILELTTDCKEQLAEIAEDTTLSPEEKERLSKEIADYYNSQLGYITSQMEGALSNQSATLGLMLDTYKTTNSDLLDTWGETNLSLLGMYSNTTEMFAGLTGAMNGYIADLWEGIQNFDNNLTNTNIAAGGKDAFGILADEINKIGENSKETEKVVDSLGGIFASEFETIMGEVAKFEGIWGSQIDAAIDKNEEFVSSLLEVISLLALVNSDDKEFTDAYNEYKSAQQKFLAGLDGQVDPKDIRYGLIDSKEYKGGIEWEEAKRKFEEFMTQWMIKRSGGIADSGEEFDTGGYTGDWGPGGRLAWLHQKELILNAADTENLLDAIGIVRTLELNAGAFINELSNLIPSMVAMEHEAIQQEVFITAEFPDVTNASEIEEAFNNLINDAMQYAYNK